MNINRQVFLGALRAIAGRIVNYALHFLLMSLCVAIALIAFGLALSPPYATWLFVLAGGILLGGLATMFIVLVRRRLVNLFRGLGSKSLPDAFGDDNVPVAGKPSQTVDEARAILLDALGDQTDVKAHSDDSALHQHSPLGLPTSSPLVTIVVPMYNEQKYVGDTLKSLIRQTFSNFKVIIIDDASTDRSAAYALKQIGGDTRFELVRHQKNSGLSASRNTGLRLCETPFVTFLDSDDILLADSLDMRLKQLEKFSNDGFVAGVYCGMASAPENITADYVPASRAFRGKVRDFINSEGECPFNAHAPVLRTEVVRKFGGFDETLLHGCEDWDLWQRIMRHGYYFIPVNTIGAVYRQKRMSMVRSMPLEHLNTGKTIFNWAHNDLASDEIVSDVPFVFTKGVDAYRSKVMFAGRILQYLAMAFLHNKKDFKALVKEFPRELFPYVKNSVSIDGAIDSGIYRFLAVDNSIKSALARTVADVRTIIRSHVSYAPPKKDEAVAEIIADFSCDVVFFPQSRRQVILFEKLASKLGSMNISSMFVSTEILTGDQGVIDFLRENNLPHVGYNRFVLLDYYARVNVVMRPYTAIVRQHADRLDSSLMEVYEEEFPVSMPDQNEQATADATVTPDEFIGVLKKILAEQSDNSQKRHPPLKDEKEGQHQIIGSNVSFLIDKEERLDLYPDHAALKAMHNQYRGKRCFIIGNGPSINDTDLTKLKDEYTIAVNGIFYKHDDMGFQPSFYVVEDSSVMKENIEAIKKYEAGHKFFPTTYRNLHPAGENVHFFLLNRGFYEQTSPSFCIPRFSHDAARRLYCGQSVTHINLQLAYYLGFEEVYLIGMDFSYVIPESAIVKGDLILSTEDDPNHFHGDYFGKGKTWKDPKLHRVQLNYEIARDAFEADGRKIYNATKGGKLEVFQRVDYDTLFIKPPSQ